MTPYVPFSMRIMSLICRLLRGHKYGYGFDVDRWDEYDINLDQTNQILESNVICSRCGQTGVRHVVIHKAKTIESWISVEESP